MDPMHSQNIKKKSPTPHTYHRDDHGIPTHEIDTFLRQTRARRPKFNLSLRRLVDELNPVDAERIYMCMRKALLYAPNNNVWGHLSAWRCKHPLCPTCPTVERNVLTGYHCGRFRSVNPDEREKPELRLRHIVLTLPREAHDFVCARRAIALPALHEAFLELLAEVYDIEPHKKRSRAEMTAKVFGGDSSAHILGNDDDPIWPRPKPHLDILLSGYRGVPDPNERDGTIRKLEPLDDKWPESWKHVTSLRWARLATKYLAKAGLPVEAHAALAQHERFSVWVTPMLTGNQAAHKVSYSVRPMIDLRGSSITDDLEEAGYGDHRRARDGSRGPWLIYPDVTKDRIRFEHVVPLGLFLSVYHHVKHDFIDGTERIRPFGFMSKNSYSRTARLAGHEPARRRGDPKAPDAMRAVRGWRQLADTDDGRPQFESFEPRIDRQRGEA